MCLNRETQYDYIIIEFIYWSNFVGRYLQN